MADTLALGATDATDLQATVTDFADYTEYFPSDLFRSLSLIRNFDETYQDSTSKIHELTKTYGSLPSLQNNPPTPQDLRKDISIALGKAYRCRESSYAEAKRLYNLCQTLTGRLTSIRTKLEAQPKPPSREATPEVSRKRAANDRTPRIKLLHDAEARKNAPRRGGLSTRRIIVPGEVLPPRDPNSPSPSAASDSEPERESSPLRRPVPPVLKLQKEKTPRPPRPEKPEKSERADKPPKEPKPLKVRPPGLAGTNAHSRVAGISVSNAIAQVVAPPPDAKIGSRYLPWKGLTEYELLSIRKRMKKNADWQPSDTMMKKVLQIKGRDQAAYLAAKRHAEETGEEFLDERPMAFVRASDQPFVLSDLVWSDGKDSLENRGMELNRAKKRKAEQRKAEAEELARLERGAIARGEDPALVRAAHASKVPQTEAADSRGQPQPKKSNKKRKRDTDQPAAPPEGAEAEADAEREQPVKKIKLKPPGPAEASATAEHKAEKDTEPGTSEEPPPAPETKASTRKTNRSAAALPRAATPAAEHTASPAPSTVPSRSTTRPRSAGSIKLNLNLPSKKAASAEPEKPRPSHRRPSDTGHADTSNARTIHLNTETAASRRGKRAAPGVLTSHPEEPGARTSLGKRKTAPSKKGTTQTQNADEGTTAPVVDDTAAPIDPEEEIYCICRQVSFGSMIACEGKDCKIEWFHMACVGLEEMAKKTRMARLTWFCPECRGCQKEGMDIDQMTGVLR